MNLYLFLAAWLPMGSALRYPINSTTPTFALEAATNFLQHSLSKDANLILPTDATWDELQIRGTSPRIQPNYNIVVEVATEADVQATILIANRFGVPFLAVSGSHGWTKTLNDFPFGIQINMRRLNSASIDEGGETATVGGGILQWEITRALYAENKQAVTGLCECVSVAGPLMGGGHSMLQAQHGYVVDNLVSARVVLANGIAVTASNSTNPDLFWALRGAGHNFGVVTSMQLKIYDIKHAWTVSTFLYTHDKLEALLRLVNAIENAATRPRNLVLIGVVTRIPTLDAKNPIITYTLSYEGPPTSATLHTIPFLALSPLHTSTSPNTPLLSLSNTTQNSLSSPACRRNHNAMGTGASLSSWNTTAARTALHIFANMTVDPRFARSVLLLENYGMQGVRDADTEATALALEERDYPVVANPTIFWEGADVKDAMDAGVFGERIRGAFFEGLVGRGERERRHVYVNYAVGTERFEEMYGWDAGRGKRLRELKKRLDPGMKFGWYNPVPVLGA